MELTIAGIIALLSFAIENEPRVADLIARHQTGEEELTPDKVKELIAKQQGESDAMNEEWKNS